jgi:glycosyltransferase involved in cell wall biosynthesis
MGSGFIGDYFGLAISGNRCWPRWRVALSAPGTEWQEEGPGWRALYSLRVFKVSILTAVTRPALLSRLYSSIVSQRVDWEWLVQLDGDAILWSPGAGDSDLIADRRVLVERNAQPSGPGTTRNLALMRATADLVLCVDDDDLLYPDSLGSLCAALDAWGQCFGAWGRTDVLSNDDVDSVPEAPGLLPRVFKSWPAPGVIEPGTIGAYFERTGEFPVHVGAVLWRRSHLVAVGGYGALPRSVDTNPFLAAEALFPVCYVDTPVYRYRLHDAQMSATPSYHAIKDRVHAFNFERARQLRRLLGPSGPRN